LSLQRVLPSAPDTNFKLGVAAATGGLALYLISMGLGFFGKSIPYIHDRGPIGIGFSPSWSGSRPEPRPRLRFIERGAEVGAPKYMEWYGAFGHLATLVWLYLEILRLLAKLQRRDRR
jgi:uncharacterized YccA/Bax inhibitor family protein